MNTLVAHRAVRLFLKTIQGQAGSLTTVTGSTIRELASYSMLATGSMIGEFVGSLTIVTGSTIGGLAGYPTTTTGYLCQKELG